jgi:hypothetical protein
MNTQNDKAYFDPIFLQMVEQGGIAAMLHECSGKSDRTCAAHPTTAGLLQQRAHSLGGIDRFLLELATEGEIVSQGSENCHMLRLVGISQSNRADALSSRHQIREAVNSNEMNMAKRTRSNSKSVVEQSRARRDAIVIRAVCARPSYSTTPNEPQSSHCSAGGATLAEVFTIRGIAGYSDFYATTKHGGSSSGGGRRVKSTTAREVRRRML